MYHKPGDVFIAACVCAYVSEGTFHDRKCFAVSQPVEVRDDTSEES